MEACSAGSDQPAAAILAAIGRVETTIGRLEKKAFHPLEKRALRLAHRLARDAWLRLKGERKGWTAAFTQLVRGFEERQLDEESAQP